MLIQSIGQLIARLRQLLLQFERLEGESVPFVLKGRQEGGNRSECGRAWTNDPGRLDGQEVFEVELIASDGILAILLNVLFDQPLLENSASLLRNDRLVGSLT